jgi:membrane protein implicated in regulation of membrane protease activity
LLIGPGGRKLPAWEADMPLTHFLGLIALVTVAAGLTLWLAFGTGVPMMALMFAALSASVILTWTRVSR